MQTSEVLQGWGPLSAAAGHPSTLSRENPFPGLRPYLEEDAPWFFGRSAEINDLLKRMRRLHFVAVVGASGSGKSSVVRAGVLPQIRDGYLESEWLISIFRPGERPIANLAESIRSVVPRDNASEIEAGLHSGPQGLVRALQASRLGAENPVMILVDQFEELFQFAQSGGDEAQEEVKAFLKLLLAAAASDDVPVYVVVTMRLEWLSECATYVGLAEAMNQGLYLVPQMSRQQFQRSILEPLELAGGSITSSLVDRMLNDLDNRSDQLPVLQHAMMRLWRRCGRGEAFDAAAYEAVGTFSMCLSAHAEEVYGRLSEAQQGVAEKLFRAITQVVQNRKIRRPRRMRDVVRTQGVSFADLTAVVVAFSRPGRSFLVTTEGELTEDSVVDLSHEALIRQWKRLKDWVESEAEIQSRLDRLGEDAAEWDRDRKAFQSCLYRDGQLRRAEELRPRLEEASPSMAFLRASVRTRLWRRARKQGLAVLAVLVAFALLLNHLHERDKEDELKLALLQAQQKQALDNFNLADSQARKDRNLRANLEQRVAAAQNDPAALAAIAHHIDAPRIYLQFTPGLVSTARSVQAELEGQGFSVPGAEQVNSGKAPAQPQIRYFHPEDRGMANRIAGLLHDAMGIDLVAQNTPNPSGVVPPGQFEVWLVAPSGRRPGTKGPD